MLSEENFQNVLSFNDLGDKNHFSVDIGVPRGQALTPIRLEINMRTPGSPSSKLSWGCLNPSPFSVLGPTILDRHNALINLPFDWMYNPAFMCLYVYTRFARLVGPYVVGDPVIAGDSSCWICL